MQIFSRKNRYCGANRHFLFEKIVFAEQIDIFYLKKSFLQEKMAQSYLALRRAQLKSSSVKIYFGAAKGLISSALRASLTLLSRM